ncbi:LuxR C-terminal-related transcriptional regulator [Escherichia coli]
MTKVECDVFELLVKGYKIANVAQYRARSLKTVSSQKHQVYKKLGIRNDVTFWGRCEQVPDMRSSYSSGAHPRGTS